jgi:hypothetical protein
MKVLALKNTYWLLAAIFGSAMWLVCPQKSFAADTAVTCNGPVVQLATGRDGTKPRVTIFCSGGSSVSGIDFFAYEISANPNVAATIPTLVGYWVLLGNTSIRISSNLDDLSGNAWGCGGANCRIIDYLEGY